MLLTDLPPELFSLISSRYLDLKDFTLFRATCTQIRSSLQPIAKLTVENVKDLLHLCDNQNECKYFFGKRHFILSPEEGLTRPQSVLELVHNLFQSWAPNIVDEDDDDDDEDDGEIEGKDLQKFYWFKPLHDKIRKALDFALGTELQKCLLKTPPNFSSLYPCSSLGSLLIGVYGGNLDVVKHFLSAECSCHYVEAEDAHLALRFACRLGLVEIMRILLDDSRCALEFGVIGGLVICIEEANIQTISLSLDHLSENFEFDFEVLEQLGEFGTEATFLPFHARLTPDNVSYVFKKAITEGNSELISSVLTSIPTFNPAADNNFPIYSATLCGKGKVLALLLKDKRTDASDLEDRAIKYAIRKKNYSIAKLLLRDSRVSATQANAVFNWACGKEDLKTVHRLLKDGRIDPTSDENFAFKTAVRVENIKLVKMLLNDGRNDVSLGEDFAINTATSLGNAKLVSLLLRYESVSPIEAYRLALKMEGGDKIILKLLANDERIKAFLRNENLQ